MSVKKDSFSLEGKNIIVTGASSGIGRQCAISCSQQGGRVILIGRNQERLNETLSKMENRQNHQVLKLDLTEFDKLEELIKIAINKHGKIDGLINCAGVSTTIAFNMVKPEKMEEFFRINVQASINLTRVVTKPPFFSEKGGSIIFISSIMGSVGEKGKSLYSMTKGALNAASNSIAIELATRKIRVNCISPGVVESPMSENAIYSRTEDSLNKIKAMHPLGLGQPEDVANACIYLLSDASKWITGTNLIVDGGYLAR